MKEICVHLRNPWLKQTVCRKEKALAEFDITGQSGIHIQTAQVNPFYALEIR
jgi:hypothetical protein